MNTVWVVIGLGIAGAVVALVTSWRRGDHAADLGAVSDQWSRNTGLVQDRIRDAERHEEGLKREERVRRVMVVRNDMPQVFVEWLER